MAKLIAQIPTPVAVSALRFQTAADLAAGHQVAISYVLPPYLIAGALTDLTGAAKVGKTRLRNFLIRCALTGACCLDRPPAAPTRVVLLTEEPLAALLEELRAAGLADRSDLLILTRFEARGTDWPAMVAAAIDQVKRHDAGLLVVDTLPGMARLEADSENSARPRARGAAPAAGSRYPDTGEIADPPYAQGRWDAYRGRSRQLGLCRGGRRTGEPDKAEGYQAKCSTVGSCGALRRRPACPNSRTSPGGLFHPCLHRRSAVAGIFRDLRRGGSRGGG